MCQNFFNLIDLNSKYVLSKKKTGRVNPRGRLYDYPPQKIVGLKFCWVVLGCPKRFFVKKKILVGLTLVGGRGGVDAPPPQKKVGLNCVGLLLVLMGDAA